MRPGFYKGLHRVLRLACGAAGVYLVLKSYAVLGKGENASHVNAFLQQLEYEAQTAAVRQVLPGLLYPAQAGKTSESLTEGIVREAFRLMPLYRYAEQALLYEDGQEEEFSLAGAEALETNGSDDAMNGQSTNSDGTGEGNGALDNYGAGEDNGTSDGNRAGSAGTGENGQLPQTRVELADSGLPSTDAGTDGEAAVETSVQPAPGGIVYSAAQLADFDFLLDHFVPAVLYYDSAYCTDGQAPSKADKKLLAIFSGNYKQDYQNTRTGTEPFDLYLRLLMVTDYISGMTDSYARTLYRELSGIE